MAKSDLTRASLEVRNMNFMNARLLGEVDLPPAPFLSELPNLLSELDTNIRWHPSSIDLVEALYLVDALSRENRDERSSAVPTSHGAIGSRRSTRRERSFRYSGQTEDAASFFTRKMGHVCWPKSPQESR
jgi:hypothetical protein